MQGKQDSVIVDFACVCFGLYVSVDLCYGSRIHVTLLAKLNLNFEGK